MISLFFFIARNVFFYLSVCVCCAWFYHATREAIFPTLSKEKNISTFLHVYYVVGNLSLHNLKAYGRTKEMSKRRFQARRLSQNQISEFEERTASSLLSNFQKEKTQKGKQSQHIHCGSIGR